MIRNVKVAKASTNCREKRDDTIGVHRNTAVEFLLPVGGLAIPPTAMDECAPAGFFKVEDLICFGRLAGELPSHSPSSAPGIRVVGGSLPFEHGEVVGNILEERYCNQLAESRVRDYARRLYYLVRPLLKVGVRKRLQRLAVRGAKRVSFPKWPIDDTTDRFRLLVVALALERSGERETTFHWFWPKGYNGCIIITHDVETEAGLDYCLELAELDASFGFPASFQLIPEKRYHVPLSLVEELKAAGCEVGVHGLNHDGALFSSRAIFESRRERLAHYARAWSARGFRSPVLYRDPVLMRELPFDFDMSYPTVAHFDPQPGGCCSLFPFFLGELVEIPLTMSQDYTLFHLAKVDPLEVWKRQIDYIVKKKGLISLNVHPDYILKEKEKRVYCQLLSLLRRLSEEERLWVTTPGEVASWWRYRASVPDCKDTNGIRAPKYFEDERVLGKLAIAGGRRKVVYECDRQSSTV